MFRERNSGILKQTIENGIAIIMPTEMSSARGMPRISEMSSSIARANAKGARWENRGR
jgi:hypothetical protein